LGRWRWGCGEFDVAKKKPNPGGSQKPAVIGGYEIVSKLGQGAVGTVYKARQLSVGRIVALKVLDPKFANDKKYVSRFLREAHSAGSLSHVNIVQGIDVNQSPEGFYYFAMEYVEGETVKHMLQRLGMIPEPEAIGIVSQVAQALRHALKIRLVHRDIKPENIIVTPQGVVKLADLGLAKSVVEDVSLTQMGQAMGTPLYISPEQAMGEEVDARSDIYSLGITLYHMLTGYTPFTGENASRVIDRHLHEQPPSPRGYNPNLSRGVCNVIEKMIAKSPADRYQEPTELIDDLAALATGSEPPIATQYARRSVMKQAMPPEPPPARKPGALSIKTVVAVAAAIIFLVGAITLYVTSRRAGTAPVQQTDSGKADTKVLPPPVKSGAGKDADRLLARARQKEDDGELPAALELYDNLARDYPDTSSGKAAAKQAAAVRKKLSDAALAQLQKEVDAALRESYGKAIQVVSDRLLDATLPAEPLNELLKKLRTERTEFRRKIVGEGNDLTRAGEFEKARSAWKRLEREGDYAEDVANGLQRIEEAIKLRAQLAARLHAKFWLQFTGIFRDKLGAGLDRAVGAADAYARVCLADAEYALIRGEIEWDRDLFKYLREVDADAAAGLKSLEGQSFEIRGKTPVHITKVTDTRVYIEREGVATPVEFNDLTADERLRLAEHQWKKTGDRLIHRAAHVIFNQLDVPLDAAKLGVPAEEQSRFSARFETAKTEAEAAALLEQASEAFRKDRWEEAQEAFARLAADYAETWTAIRNAGPIREKRATAARAILAAAVPKKFRGKVQLQPDARWRLEWDFSDPRQIDDFDTGEAPDDPRFRDAAKQPVIHEGCLKLKGRDAIVRPVFKGTPLTIEYRVRLLQENARTGYGRVYVASQLKDPVWEFAWCHGSRALKEVDYLRNIYTLGRTETDCWRANMETLNARDRSAWHQVKCEITETAATVRFDRNEIYNSSLIRTPNTPDPSALPDLSRFYRVRLGSWQPDDVWAFDDLAITGPVDMDWLKTLVGGK